MADDQGWGDVGYMGHPVLLTPVLDAMAATGLRFDRFYAAHPVCSPTRGSFLTGRHPNRFACFSWGHTLRPEEVTIAEALKRAGYATGHFGKWHLGSVQVDDPVSPGGSGFDEWVSSPNYYENDPLMSHRGKVIALHGESSEVTARAAIEFIRSARTKKQPFLAVVWFGNPHRPHVATDELRALYPDSTDAEQHYYGEITGIDRAMGLLRNELQSLGIAQNTLLWYTSDNGQQANSPGSSGGLRGAKGSLWEGGVRIPAILEWPARIESPRETTFPASTSDIFPTVLELAGATVDTQRPLDGVSLADLVNGTSTERSKPIGFWVRSRSGIVARSADLLSEMKRAEHGQGPRTIVPDRTPASRMEKKFAESDLPGNAAWVDGDWKLHKIAEKGGMFRYELYNLASDAAEKRDLSGESAVRIIRMKDELTTWQQSVVRSLNGEDY